jgi:hypothetical protein
MNLNGPFSHLENAPNLIRIGLLLKKHLGTCEMGGGTQKLLKFGDHHTHDQ